MQDNLQHRVQATLSEVVNIFPLCGDVIRWSVIYIVPLEQYPHEGGKSRFESTFPLSSQFVLRESSRPSSILHSNARLRRPMRGYVR